MEKGILMRFSTDLGGNYTATLKLEVFMHSSVVSS